MAESRTQKAKRNLFSGMVNRAVAMLMPFLSRTALIHILGMQYVGLNSLFASILQVLNLADLGIGTAIVYALYEPAANDDKPAIRALMNYYRRVYRTIGCVIAVAGLALLPFLPRLIKDNPPADVSLTVLYLTYLANTVVSYWLFAYKQALPTAMQRVDVVSNVNTVTNILLNLAQVLVLVLWHNYYAYLFIIPTCTVINNLLMSWHVDHTYPDLKPAGTISEELRASIRKRVAGLTIQRVCATTRNSLDRVFLSAFIGLTVTAIYDNYLLILAALTSVLSVVSTAILPTVGNSIVTDSAEKNYADMRVMNFVYMMISGWCSSCLLCLYQPFMELWAGGDMMLPMSCVLLFSVYFYVLKMSDIRTLYAESVGIWWEARYLSVAEAASNLLLNWLFIRALGLPGILLATLISYLVFNFAGGSLILFRYYFTEGGLKDYMLSHLKYLLVTAAAAALTFAAGTLVPFHGLPELLIKGILCIFLPGAFYLLLYGRSRSFREAMPRLYILFHLKRKGS